MDVAILRLKYNKNLDSREVTNYLNTFSHILKVRILTSDIARKRNVDNWHFERKKTFSRKFQLHSR